LANEITIRGREEDHNSSESFTNLWALVSSFTDNGFDVLVEVGGTVD
jgi:hypothetical protein